MPPTPVPLNDVERLKALPGLGFESNGYQYANTISRIEFNLDRPVFKDVRVRRAFAHTIDREVIRDVVNYGYGKTIVGPISASLTKFYVDDLKTYPTDLKAAERLLDDAGYRRGADYIKQALAKIGVEVAVRNQDFPSYTKRVYTDRDYRGLERRRSMPLEQHHRNIIWGRTHAPTGPLIGAAVVKSAIAKDVITQAAAP